MKTLASVPCLAKHMSEQLPAGVNTATISLVLAYFDTNPDPLPAWDKSLLGRGNPETRRWYRLQQPNHTLWHRRRHPYPRPALPLDRPLTGGFGENDTSPLKCHMLCSSTCTRAYAKL